MLEGPQIIEPSARGKRNRPGARERLRPSKVAWKWFVLRVQTRSARRRSFRSSSSVAPGWRRQFSSSQRSVTASSRAKPASLTAQVRRVAGVCANLRPQLRHEKPSRAPAAPAPVLSSVLTLNSWLSHGGRSAILACVSLELFNCLLQAPCVAPNVSLHLLPPLPEIPDRFGFSDR